MNEKPAETDGKPGKKPGGKPGGDGAAEAPRDFIRDIIAEDVRTGKWDGRVQTRFPPEPNGFLHIGHAKAICLDFGVAKEFGGHCNLRFDDTNPTTEEERYAEAIREDIRWLGFDWGEDGLKYASDYFQEMYDHAVKLVEAEKAYVDDQSPEQIAETRGTVTEPGRPSPWRDRPVEESLDLLARMKAGEFEEGSKVLRAKIDMAHDNMLMRDPVMYRILKAPHYRTGTEWCIYPMYDWAHGLEDSIERVTHSLCTLEFEVHRPLYDWYLDALGVYHPQQIEFARLNLSYTVVSKRWLLQLVEEGHVDGWDDPRMPTLRGLRRRGVPASAIRAFCKTIGVAKFNSTIALELFDHHVRADLNKTAPRFMGVLRPLRVVIENYPEGESEELQAVNNPEDPAAGKRSVPFSRVLYVERDDFMEEPPKKFFRLAPGREVRLRYAYFITCKEVVKDESGEVVELRCTYDPATKGGDSPDGRKVKATLHWVSAEHALDAEVRLYDRLFTVEDPAGQKNADWNELVNPDSREVLAGAKVEPAVVGLEAFDPLQFERQGYFCVDPDSAADRLVFNRTVTLRDAWKKLQKRAGA